MAKSLRLKNLPPARTRFAPEETTSEMLQTHLERETVKDRQRQEREAKEVTEEVTKLMDEFDESSNVNFIIKGLSGGG